MDDNVKDAKVKSYITNAYAYDVVSSSGLDGKDELIAYFHKNVSDPKLEISLIRFASSGKA